MNILAYTLLLVLGSVAIVLASGYAASQPQLLLNPHPISKTTCADDQVKSHCTK